MHLVLLVVAATLPLLVLAGGLTAMFWHQQRAAYEQQFLERTRALALALDREQDGHIRVLQTLARSTLLAEGNLAGFYEQAKAVMDDQPGWSTVILADLQSNQLLTLRLPFGTALPKAALGEEAIAQIARTGRPHISPLIMGSVTRNHVTHMGVPVRRGGVITHVLIAAVDSPAWLAFLRKYPVATDATLTLLDQKGMVIARTLNNEASVGRPAPAAFFDRVRAAPESAFQATGLEGQPLYAAFSRSTISGWTIATGVPSQTVERALWRSTLAIIAGAFLSLGCAAGLAYFFSRRIARSIAALAAFATSLGSTQDPSSSSIARASSKISEVNTLATALDESAAGLRTEHLERVRVQQALQASEERYRALTAASSDVLYRMSPDWREMRHLDSRGFLESTSSPTDEWSQKYIPVDEQPRVAQAIDEAIRDKSTFELEHRVLRVDGSCGWTLSRAVPVLDGHGEIVEWFGAASDITNRRNAEEALRAARVSAEKAKAEAEKANAAKDHFLAVLSHELRTPLAPVLAAADLLQRRNDQDAGARRSLEIIRRNVKLQARLIDDLLDIARITQGKLELKREATDIAAVIEHAVEVARPGIDAKKLRLAVALEGMPGQVFVDPLRLQQVLWNLLSNATKFTPEGGSVSLHCERLNENVVIEVSDSGVGFEPEAAERIFRPFEQGERGTTRQFGGLGLGLTIARRLVEMHGGTLSVQSAGRDQGATSRVLLPSSTAPQAPPVGDPAQDSGSATP